MKQRGNRIILKHKPKGIVKNKETFRFHTNQLLYKRENNMIFA